MDLGIQLVGVGLTVRDVHNNAAGVLVGGTNRGIQCLTGMSLLSQYHQSQHTAAAEAAVSRQLLGKFLGNSRNIRVVQMRNHGRLQARLSRSSIRCAERGPHEPDS